MMPKGKPRFGWILFVSALGMMSGLLADDIKRLTDWKDITTPQFVGNIMTHFASVVAAFIGGRMLPPKRNSSARTRKTDF